MLRLHFPWAKRLHALFAPDPRDELIPVVSDLLAKLPPADRDDLLARAGAQLGELAFAESPLATQADLTPDEVATALTFTAPSAPSVALAGGGTAMQLGLFSAHAVAGHSAQPVADCHPKTATPQSDTAAFATARAPSSETPTPTPDLRPLLRPLSLADLIALRDAAIRLHNAAVYRDQQYQQASLRLFHRTWHWHPRIIGASPRIIGDE